MIMPNKTRSSKLLIGIYAIFLIVGLLGVIVVKKGTVLNSFDLMINASWYFVLPAAIVLSVLLLHIIAKNPRFVALKLALKLFLHALSVVCLSWGIFGGMNYINKMDQYANDHEMKGALIELRKQEPANIGLKNTYKETRYFISFRDASSQRDYTFEIGEKLYESFDYPAISIDFELNGEAITEKPREVNISLKKGCLGFIY